MSNKPVRIFSSFVAASLILTLILTGFANPSLFKPIKHFIQPLLGKDSIPGKDSIDLKYPIKNNSNTPLKGQKSNSLDLKDPPVYKTEFELDSSMKNYKVYNTVNGLRVGDEQTISLADYLRENGKMQQRNYFKDKTRAQNFTKDLKNLAPKLTIKTPKIIDKIIGSGIDIKPNGSAELIFSYDVNRVANPAWSVKQQRNGQFKFDQKIQLNVKGSIANKINLSIGYSTETNFDFDNEIKLRYDGEEDDIVKLIEAGNVSLPIQGSLITGSQSLFGIKTKLQFGKLMVTSVFSQQKSEKKEITLENGAQKNNFSISALEYDANRHFFLSQYFRNNVFEQAFNKLPILTSPVQITRIEVWVVNRSGGNTDVRDMVAFMDLGEPKPYNSSNQNPDKGTFVEGKGGLFPSNNANTLYEKLASPTNKNFRSSANVSNELATLNVAPYNFYNGQDYIKVNNARKLQASEYTVNQNLGFISLNQRIDPGYALAVAFEYTMNGVRYQVGEFAQDIPPNPNEANVLFLKLIKPTATRTDLPIWDLMMKNIYALNSSQIQQNDFKLDVIYEDDKSGGHLNYIPEPSEPKLNGQFLIRVLGFDRLNSQQEESPDGVFDFLEGRTIFAGSGLIMFPYLEPFGTTLRNAFANKTIASKYVFQALYDSTQTQAEQLKQFDKFYLRGHYMGASGSEISLNAINIPEGSVQVTAGGIPLRENVDYTVDYTLGKVKIINESILNSGTPIKVTAESNSLFSIQQKTLIGTRLDYKISNDFNIGGTFLYLKEKPLTQKVNIGDEPINNIIWGIDGNYKTDAPFITKLIDKIPFIETKEKSVISVNGEFAQLIPGHPKVIGKKGTSYIDDFEGSEVPYDLRTGNYWVQASTPQGQTGIFKHGNDRTKKVNFNRGLLSWYTIDDLFYRDISVTPGNITKEMLSHHWMREVLEKEVFQNKQLPQGIPQTLRTFDLAYFPNERGCYNYDYNLTDSGKLKNPEENWGGIMRKIETNDFEAANIEYIEFWMMDPYFWMDDPKPKGGKMYFNLGEISEDVLRDGELFFENGLSKSSNKPSLWGYAPAGTAINYAFDNDPSTRSYQDVGYDGLSDAQELIFDSTFIQNLPPALTPAARNQILQDPSADDYMFYNDPAFTKQNADIIERYKRYRNSENNSPVSTGSQTLTAGSLSPDVEDINNDFTLNETEAYYQYTVAIEPNMIVGENYIVDKQISPKTLANGKSVMVPWYQFKIPIQDYSERIGQIRDFKSIRFMRLMLAGFDQEVVLRFARLQLVRGDWRRYLYNFDKSGEIIPNDPVDTTAFDVSTVNIEANGKRDPIPYVLPPGIEREVDYTTTQLLEQNEQSLSFSICGLADGNSKAAYKSTFFDVRTYKRLKMYVHAEGANLKPGDMAIFIRLGTDFSRDYYEYELPLYPTKYGETDPNAIWDTRNAIDIAFDDFFRVKQMRENNSASSLEPYSSTDQNGNGRVTVMGNPDLSNVKVVMVGLRNPSRDDNPWAASDDGSPVCGIVWINELRVSDFDEKGGWAAVGRVSANLADFGNLAVTGNKKTIGYGGLEQKLQERSKEDSRGFGVQSYFELGKFFKEESGIKIPLYYDYSQQKATPEYNPLSPDIKLQTKLDIAKNKAERDSILYATETFLQRQSLNLSNVQKMRKGTKKARFYDVENFILTYAYSNTYKRDITTAFDIMKTYKFVLNYNYNFKEYYFTPFGKLVKSKYLKLVSDFNIGLVPQSFAFKAEVDRRYGQVLYRNTDEVQSLLTPIYTKSFTMKRTYDLKHNFAKSLRFSYNANVDANIREPEGKVTPQTRDTMWSNFMKLGETKNFNQRVTLTYDLPLKKIPFAITDWITSQATYNGSYNWEEAPRTFKGDSLGNVIQNAQAMLLNTQLNFVNLYSKINYLKTINQGKSNVSRIKKERLKKLKEEERKKGNKDWNKLTEDDILLNEGLINLGDYAFRVLMSLRSVNVNYSINNGTVLPGFRPRPEIVGNDWGRNAPGLPFILGWQDDIRSTAALNGWLTTDTSLNSLYMTNHSESFVIQATLEPIKGLRVNIDMDRRLTSNHQEVFRMMQDGTFQTLSPIDNGSFSMSFFSIRTAFAAKWDEKKTAAYVQFENNRYPIAQRLNHSNTVDPNDSFHFPLGYSRTSQQVIIPAFIAAYTGKNSNSISTDLFQRIPGINWRISYTGLSNIEFLKDWVKNISLNHAYNSTYNISSFSSSLEYDPNQVEQAGKDIIPEYRVQQISFTEQLSPLIGIDISWANNWTTTFEYRTNRTIAFSFSNFQTSEIRGKDFTIGVGYRAKEVKLPFKLNHKKAFLEHELTVRVDVSIKNNISTIIKLDEKVLEQSTQNVGGSKVVAIKPTIDYELSKNLKLKIFFTRNVNTPVISTSYPTKFTNIGFSLIYTLGQ